MKRIALFENLIDFAFQIKNLFVSFARASSAWVKQILKKEKLNDEENRTHSRKLRIKIEPDEVKQFSERVDFVQSQSKLKINVDPVKSFSLALFLKNKE